MTSPYHCESASGASVPESRVAPRVFPSTGFAIIPDTEKFEEENLPWYKPQSFYPVNIGDVLASRYQVLYKIGHGTTSTVWICRDLDHDKYVCMKAMVQDYPSVGRELRAYELLSQEEKTTSSFGTIFVRKRLDQFQLHHGQYDYHFLIHEPLGLDLETVLILFKGRYPLKHLKSLSSDFSRALEFVHGAKVVHADIKPDSIHFKIGDEIVLGNWEEEEIANPSPRKFQEQSRTIFAQKQFNGSADHWITNKSIPVLCDFGEARSGKDSYIEIIQPPEYRAPEVFLHIAWGTPVDVWSLGCMIWFIATGKALFPRTEDSDVDDTEADGVQLATMAMLLGRPPAEMLVSTRALKFFDEDGAPKFNVLNETLESRFAVAFEGARNPPTAEEATDFLDFIRRVLIWDNKKRPSASQLLNDPWITGGQAVLFW